MIYSSSSSSEVSSETALLSFAFCFPTFLSTNRESRSAEEYLMKNLAATIIVTIKQAASIKYVPIAVRFVYIG